MDSNDLEEGRPAADEAFSSGIQRMLQLQVQLDRMELISVIRRTEQPRRTWAFLFIVLRMLYNRKLPLTAAIVDRFNSDESLRVNITEMQSLRLRKLQWKLTKHAADIQLDHKEPDDWEKDVDRYIKMVKDYEYMIKWSNTPQDPFLVTGERLLDRMLLQGYFGSRRGDLGGQSIDVPGPWEQDIRPVGGFRDENDHAKRRKGIKQRLLMATLGASFLIVPMVIMSLKNTLPVCLIASTCFIVAFGLTMVVYLSESKEVLSSTAAYAAVLVVFVGLGVEKSDI